MTLQVNQNRTGLDIPKYTSDDGLASIANGIPTSAPSQGSTQFSAADCMTSSARELLRVQRYVAGGPLFGDVNSALVKHGFNGISSMSYNFDQIAEKLKNGGLMLSASAAETVSTAQVSPASAKASGGTDVTATVGDKEATDAAEEADGAEATDEETAEASDKANTTETDINDEKTGEDLPPSVPPKKPEGAVTEPNKSDAPAENSDPEPVEKTDPKEVTDDTERKARESEEASEKLKVAEKELSAAEEAAIARIKASPDTSEKKEVLRLAWESDKKEKVYLANKDNQLARREYIQSRVLLQNALANVDTGYAAKLAARDAARKVAEEKLANL